VCSFTVQALGWDRGTRESDMNEALPFWDESHKRDTTVSPGRMLSGDWSTVMGQGKAINKALWVERC